ncbi:MAG TPA: hypothetical protein DD381_13125 [Lentisphaeria bacterium]|nr:MAG: hypothetical protein A2X47_11600 [Lentisphaerae bacterium GWF2_38_69]HBM17264.1 hypothetical protein [Lentisphaeria bacterium]
MNRDDLTLELIDFGYAGKVNDLIDYAGSLEALSWYWESYLKKLLKASRSYFRGGFIRTKVKREARTAYEKHVYESKKDKRAIAEEIEALRKKQAKEKAFEEQLDKWFSSYEKQTDKEQQYEDLKEFVEYSGHFDYMDNFHKRSLLSIESPVHLNHVKRNLFYHYFNLKSQGLSI